MKQEVVTSDLALFGYRELKMVADLLTAYCQGNWAHDNNLGDGVTVAMNTNSGNVWLQDEDYNCVMLNRDKLEAHVFTPYQGIEGFITDMLNKHDMEQLVEEDRDFIVDFAQSVNLEVTNDLFALCSDEIKERYEDIISQQAEHEQRGEDSRG